MNKSIYGLLIDCAVDFKGCLNGVSSSWLPVSIVVYHKVRY